MESSAAVEGTGAGAHGAAISQAGEVRSARVESLRAIAALGVLEGHVYGSAHGYGPDTLATFGHRVLFGGGFGVYLFFVLTGYLIYWPFARRDFAAGPQIRLKRYGLNRALRILPLYYAVFAILFVVQETGTSFSEWWRFGVFAENFSHATFERVDGVAWSLVVELHFYLLLPLLAYLIARLGGRSLARAGIILAALGIGAFALRYATFLSVPARQSDTLLRFSLPSLFEYFAIGMGLALLRVRFEREPVRLPGPLGNSDTWLLAAVPLWALVFWHYNWELVAGAASVLMLGACVLPLRAGRLVRALDWRPLAVLGVASYSLYLWHMPIVDHLAGSSWAPHSFLGLAAVAVPLSIATALVSYRVIEAPFLRLRRRWVGAPKEPTAQPGASAPALAR
jgi:peptidoglycan/LPS O-acetylase OafA/YrhL